MVVDFAMLFVTEVCSQVNVVLVVFGKGWVGGGRGWCAAKSSSPQLGSVRFDSIVPSL